MPKYLNSANAEFNFDWNTHHVVHAVLTLQSSWFLQGESKRLAGGMAKKGGGSRLWTINGSASNTSNVLIRNTLFHNCYNSCWSAGGALYIAYYSEGMYAFTGSGTESKSPSLLF